MRAGHAQYQPPPPPAPHPDQQWRSSAPSPAYILRLVSCPLFPHDSSGDRQERWNTLRSRAASSIDSRLIGPISTLTIPAYHNRQQSSVRARRSIQEKAWGNQKIWGLERHGAVPMEKYEQRVLCCPGSFRLNRAGQAIALQAIAVKLCRLLGTDHHQRLAV